MRKPARLPPGLPGKDRVKAGLMLRGLSLEDRKLFLALCSALADTTMRLVALGEPPEATAGHMLVLKQAKDRLAGKTEN